MITFTRVLFAFVLLAFPGAALLLLFVSPFLLLFAAVRNRREPGSVPAERITVYKILLAVAAGTVGFLALDFTAMIVEDNLRIAGYNPPGAVMIILLILLLLAPMAFAAVCGILYALAATKNNSEPGSVPAKWLLILKTLAIVSGAMVILLGVIVIAFFASIPLLVRYITG